MEYMEYVVAGLALAGFVAFIVSRIRKSKNKGPVATTRPSPRPRDRDIDLR